MIARGVSAETRTCPHSRVYPLPLDPPGQDAPVRAFGSRPSTGPGCSVTDVTAEYKNGPLFSAATIVSVQNITPPQSWASKPALSRQGGKS